MVAAQLHPNPKYRERASDKVVRTQSGSARQYFALLAVGMFALVVYSPVFAQRAQLRQLATAGDVQAMLRLAEAYTVGLEGCPVRPDSALYFASVAASAGHPEGQHLLGIAKLRGIGVAQEPAAGLRLLELAASQQHRQSQELLMDLYTTPLVRFGSNPIPTNPAKAAEWARRAAENGSERAAFFLAECYREGKGLARNDSLAEHWMTVAATRYGLPSAQLTLADWYFLGKLNRFDFPNATRYYAMAETNPRADWEQQAMARVGRHEVIKVERRLFNLTAVMGFIDPQTTPQLKIRP
jgi:hypothetical protein